MADLKTKIKHLLEENNITAAGACVGEDRKAMTVLIRLAYDKETLVGWRAILAVGEAARGLAVKDHAFLREVCRKLFWSLNDESGGIGWSAPEMLGEIVAADPVRFADLVPMIAGVFNVEEDTFRAGAIYGLRRIAEHRPDAVLSQYEQLLAALSDCDPRTRIFGLQVIALLWHHAIREGYWTSDICQRAKKGVQKLLEDPAEAWIYDNDAFQSIVVGETASTVNKIF